MGMGCIGLPVIIAYIGPLIASLLAIVLRPHLVMVVVTVTVTLFYSAWTVHWVILAQNRGDSISEQRDPGKAKELLRFRYAAGQHAKHFAFCTLLGLTGLTSQLVRMRLARLRRQAATPGANR